MENKDFEVLYEELVPELQAHISDLNTQNLLLKIHVKKLNAVIAQLEASVPVDLPPAQKIARKKVD